MTYLQISILRNSSILRIYSERERIQTNPDYQRMGEIWNLEKRQLLIDSILNDFDIPKLYFHEFPDLKELPDGKKIKYAIIDGRQRLEAIWAFIDGKFALSEYFVFFEDPGVKAKNLTYSDLANKYPELKTRIDSHTLPIITVATEDLELIEEMFSRLNEAVPLNAAEKRNAMGGEMAKVIRDVSNHYFFKFNIPFSNKRYQHREMSAKLLLLSDLKTIGDTKKAYLDNMVKTYKDKKWVEKARELGKDVKQVLDHLSNVFVEKDPLLKTQAMTVIYYLVMRDAIHEGWFNHISRKVFLDFEGARSENRKKAEEDITKANYELIEFDRMHLQGSNDAVSIRERLKTLKGFVKNDA